MLRISPKSGKLPAIQDSSLACGYSWARSHTIIDVDFSIGLGINALYLIFPSLEEIVFDLCGWCIHARNHLR